MNKMNKIVRFLGGFTLSVSTFAAVLDCATAQETPTAPQQNTTQKICSFDAVENLLPPFTESSNSTLSYLAQQGFTPKSDGSWLCYVSDSQKTGRYYTIFKVQQVDGRLVASSFLENAGLIDGQEERSLDLFMMLLQKQTNTTQQTRQNTRKYLEAFISLVKQGKIHPSERGFLFNQPSSGYVLYHPVKSKDFQGTAITLNINLS